MTPAASNSSDAAPSGISSAVREATAGDLRNLTHAIEGLTLQVQLLRFEIEGLRLQGCPQ